MISDGEISSNALNILDSGAPIAIYKDPNNSHFHNEYIQAVRTTNRQFDIEKRCGNGAAYMVLQTRYLKSVSQAAMDEVLERTKEFLLPPLEIAVAAKFYNAMRDEVSGLSAPTSEMLTDGLFVRVAEKIGLGNLAPEMMKKGASKYYQEKFLHEGDIFVHMKPKQVLLGRRSDMQGGTDNTEEDPQTPMSRKRKRQEDRIMNAY
eukprot:Rmarinus@m.22247